MPIVRAGSVIGLIGLDQPESKEFAPSVTTWNVLPRRLLFFALERDGGHHVYVSQGNDPAKRHVFGPPTLVAGINEDGATDSHPEVSGDGLLLLLDSTRGAVSSRLYLSGRGSSGEPWASPRWLDELADGGTGQFHASLSGDGALLVYVVGVPPYFQLWQAWWNSSAATFEDSTPLTGLPADSASPALTPDGLTVVFSSVEAGKARLFVARRATLEGTEFDCFHQLEGLGADNSFHDLDPFVTRDGTELFFVSTRSDGGVARMYLADLDWE
jgi:Tol biopolymer transport system component